MFENRFDRGDELVSRVAFDQGNVTSDGLHLGLLADACRKHEDARPVGETADLRENSVCLRFKPFGVENDEVGAVRHQRSGKVLAECCVGECLHTTSRSHEGYERGPGRRIHRNDQHVHTP